MPAISAACPVRSTASRSRAGPTSREGNSSNLLSSIFTVQLGRRVGRACSTTRLWSCSTRLIWLGDQGIWFRGDRQCSTAGHWGRRHASSQITSSRSASAPQEIDSIRPVPIPSFSCQSAQGPDQTSDIRGRNRFFIHENHAAVVSLFFRPDLEQGRNRPPVIGNKRQSLGGGFAQTSVVLLSQEIPIFPFHQVANFHRAIAATQTLRYVRRDVLIEKKLEHFSFLPLYREQTPRPEATCASAFQNRSPHSQRLHH